MRKINILTVLGTVGFFCVGGIDIDGAGQKFNVN